MLTSCSGKIVIGNLETVQRHLDEGSAMRVLRWMVLLWATIMGGPVVAQAARPVPPAARQALDILTHLDLDGFPNSTGPRRKPIAHTPADYGLTVSQGFPDGWAQVTEPDESWVMGALVLETDQAAATICFTDSAGPGGTYRATQVLHVERETHGRWTARAVPDRSDCKNDPAQVATSPAIDAPAPAALLQHLDDFRDALSPADRARLDRRLRRSGDGGIAQCDRAERSLASCEVAAYWPALHDAGLMPRFLASPGPVPSAKGLMATMARTGVEATARTLSSAGWDVALDAAAAGRADWIEAVATLRPATDARRGEAIDRALSDALSINPAAVLRLIATRRDLPGATWYCQDRSIEPSAAAVKRHDAAAVTAVARVTDPALGSVRDRCLAQFAITRTRPRQ